MQQAEKEKELIQNCDAVVWFSYKDETGTNTKMTFMKSAKQVKPTELGYKYSILMFKERDAKSIDIFSAIIGDPQAYVTRVGNLGYHGLMLKHKSCTKKDIKVLFQSTLDNWGFSKLQIANVLKSLV